MTLHKLTAGSGYDYLTRQVAALDSTEKGRTSLSAYYAEKGEAPGVWVGSGLAGIDGLGVGDVVTVEQMKSLFAYGHHPLAEDRIADLGAAPTEAEVRVAQRLGRPFRVIEGEVPQFQVDLARRLGELNVAAGLPADAPTSVEDRARVRSDLAREYFRAEYGRDPVDAREVAATVAKHSRPRTTAVAGFDLTFSPVKSVSTLWAVAGPDVAAAIEQAHDAAVGDALAFIERHALFTRKGAAGVQQVDVRGLVAASFTHRDSRAGDPDLHTHVAVSNKVQTLDGDWLAVDGRVLFKAGVAASETYNTALEARLVEALGVRFAERAGADPRKRPVREIVGVDPALNARWSSRRNVIDARTGELATKFQHDHGRPPTPVEAINLAQQATLETRDAKHEPRSQAEQRDTWRAEAAQVLGGPRAVARMFKDAVWHRHPTGAQVTKEWISQLAEETVNTVAGRRATWQTWHLRAEALRRVRTGDVRPGRVEGLVGRIVETAIGLSVPLVSDRDLVDDPDHLRRCDGTSVFHTAGSELFTNRAVLDAEDRLVNAAGRTDGRTVAESVVELTLLESTANGAELNPGQAGLVRDMTSSGARLQLAIAAAGAGKTTAMRVLTRAWEESGGNVVGLAPSAAAASVLSEQTRTQADTLAKVVHHITDGSSSGLADAIGPNTLVVIDEAGMADTLSLDTVVGFALGRGASVRLIGDDQQLAAIGAGGVLRDIDHQHGAVRLAELMRFADPAEGAASLALRDGHTEAIGFYLDTNRAHLGDLATMTDGVFAAWQADTAAGKSSIMLAPTRDLVADLNNRARQARLARDGHAGPEVRLSDGNMTSVGDTVITRQNDRLLRLTPTDWVKNGDRWTVTGVNDGRVAVRHAESGLEVVLPAEYVAAHAELGYASTVHTAQGVSVDSMHGLVNGQENRQQFYTMMTRGKLSNDFYLITPTDGDPHNLIRPETTHPRTLTDVIEGVLARDGAPVSATTTAREAAAPAARLGQAAARYTETIHAGAERLIGPDRVAELVTAAEEVAPGIVDEPAWPTLRAHLILIEAHGRDAAHALATAAAGRPLDGVRDRAAILDWRLDPTGMRGTTAGPLPWLPAIPNTLLAHPELRASAVERARMVRDLTAHVRAEAIVGDTPEWARQGAARPADHLLADVTVWRSATGVDPADRRPTGPPRPQKAMATQQRRLNERLDHGRQPALAEWGPAIDGLVAHRDDFTPLLAVRLAAINRAGLDAARLLRAAAEQGALPDDHATAALWWRISRHLTPAVAEQTRKPGQSSPTGWSDRLVQVVGEERATELTTSPWWPTLMTQVEHASQRGWSVEDLLTLTSSTDVYDVDHAQALVWRIGVVTNPPPADDETFIPPPDPRDIWVDDQSARSTDEPSRRETETVDALAATAIDRRLLGPLEPTDADLNRILDKAYLWDHAPITGDRILQINTMTADYFESQLHGSWSQQHLIERLGQDISGDPRFRPGHAPAEWTNLVTHLRAAGVTDDEMLAAGVATIASTGRLIDRFRNRMILPIIHDNQVLGFVGRRHPDLSDDDRGGPKYLNTADTIVFHKGNQLYGLPHRDEAIGSIPVLVEGPVDAIAVTVATGGAFIGLAPLGTSTTVDQAAQLASIANTNQVDPVVATDADTAGHVAAERAFWLLAPHLVDPRAARLADGQDPAGILQQDGPAALTITLQSARPLADQLTTERLTLAADASPLSDLTRIVAARPPEHWQTMIAETARNTGAEPADVRHAVITAASSFNGDRRRYASQGLADTTATRQRLDQAAAMTPADRWAPMAEAIDSRLTTQPDWAATAAMLQDIHDTGRDVTTLTRTLVNADPLGEHPAQDLRYRLVGYLPESTNSGWPTAGTPFQRQHGQSQAPDAVRLGRQPPKSNAPTR